MPDQGDEIEVLFLSFQPAVWAVLYGYRLFSYMRDVNRTAQDPLTTKSDANSNKTLKFSTFSEPPQEIVEAEKSDRNSKRLALKGVMPAPYVGISNLGNTCYLNSCLQVLYYIPDFCEGLTLLCNELEEVQCQLNGMPEMNSSAIEENSKTDRPEDADKREIEILREFLKSLTGLYAQLGPYDSPRPTDQSAVDAKFPGMSCHSACPRPFLRALNAANELFGAASEQQDVHEFWGWLISYLESGHAHAKKKLNECAKTGDSTLSDSQKRSRKNKKYPEEAGQPNTSAEQKAGLVNDEQTYKKRKKTEIDLHQTFNDSSFVEKMFRGEIRSTVKCLECESESHRNECFYDISLSIEGEKTQELSCLLDQFVKKCLLCKSEKYKCSSCLSDVEAFFFTKIHRLPKVLVFHLKRFEWRMNNRNGEMHGYIPQMNKISHHISYPEKLVIDPKWMCCEASSIDELSKTSKTPEYSLYGIIFHLGTSTYYGHYTAAVRLPESEAQEGKEWIILDDQRVSYASQQDIVNAYSPEFRSLSTAYMLFYLKT